MGCKLSISVVHPSRSPVQKKSRKPIESPIFNKFVKEPTIPDDDSYIDVYLDSPDSERTKV